MNKIILWQIANQGCRVNHNYSYESLPDTNQVRILHDRFYDKPIINLPFLHLSKLTNLRFEAEHEKYIHLVYYLNPHEITDLCDYPLVREQLYRSFVSHVNYCVALYEVNTENEFLPIQVKSLESFISPINLFSSKLVYEWFCSFPFELTSEWVELASGFITPLKNPQVYELEGVYQDLPHISLRTGFLDHPFVKYQENKRICLVVPDELYQVYKMQPNTLTRQKRVRLDQDSCIWLYSEKEWHLNWYSYRNENEKKTNCMAWHMIHCDDMPDLPSTFAWDEFYWITNQSISLKNLGFSLPYSNAKKTFFIPLNFVSWSIIISSCLPRIIGYLLWKHRVGSPTLHSMVLFSLVPEYWKRVKDRMTFEHASIPEEERQVEIVSDDFLVRLDDWDNLMNKLLEDRGDHFEQKKLQWGLSNYHYPQWTTKTTEIYHHNIQETCPVTYESSLTKSMIQWNCGHFIEAEAHWKWLATKTLSNHPATCPMCRYHVNSGLTSWRLLRNKADDYEFEMSLFGSHVNHLLSWIKSSGSGEYGVILPKQPFGSSLWNQIQKWVKCWTSTGKRRNYHAKSGVLLPLASNLPMVRPVQYPDVDLFENIQVIKQAKTPGISLSPRVERWVYIWENNLDMKPFENWVRSGVERQIYVCQETSPKIKIIKTV